MKDKILKQYNVVFDKNNNVRNCGRIQCIKLISMLEDYTNKNDFGNNRTGFMDVNNIRNFITSIS